MRDATPLYVAFNSARSHYVYDTYSNHIAEMSESEVSKLPSIVASVGGARDESDAACPNPAGVGDGSGIPVPDGMFHPVNLDTMAFYRDNTILLHRVGQCVPHLTIEVTERCNSRCEYCSYSYHAERLRAPRDMDWQTAVNAIKVFADHSRLVDVRAMSFWGGEPLLRTDFISACIEFIRTDYPGLCPRLSLTTNGTAITNAVAQVLVASEVNILVSLDGPAEVHDRCRRAANGRGTFESVIEGLERLRRMDVDYYARCVRFNCVLTPGTDLRAVDEFFSSHPLTRQNNVQFHTAAPLDTSFFATHGPFTEEQNRYMRQSALKVVTDGSGQEPQGVAASWLKRFEPIALRARCPLQGSVTLNGCCVPLLRRLHVSVDGAIHLCERTPPGRPVGDVNTGGVDMQAVRSLVDEYVAQSLPDCRTCWAVRLCSACYLDFMHAGRWDAVSRAEQCEGRRASVLRAMSEYVAILEDCPSAFAYLKGRRFFVPM